MPDHRREADRRRDHRARHLSSLPPATRAADHRPTCERGTLTGVSATLRGPAEGLLGHKARFAARHEAAAIKRACRYPWARLARTSDLSRLKRGQTLA